MKKILIFFLFVQNASAIIPGYYVPGVQGIRDIEQPDKGWGIYWYNSFYNSHRVNDNEGDEGVLDEYDHQIVYDLDSYISFPYFYWMSGKKILGASYGLSANLIIGKIWVNSYEKGVSDSNRESGGGVGDLLVTPFIIAWDRKNKFGIFQISVGMPVGKFKRERNDNFGLGYWALMPQFGGMYYFGKEEKDAIMLFTTFEFKSDYKGSDTKPGSVFSIETGYSHFFTQRFSAGINLYYQTQMFADENLPTSFRNWKQSDAALGGELNYWFKPAIWGLTLRYNWEFMAKAGFQGGNAIVNLYYNR